MLKEIFHGIPLPLLKHSHKKQVKYLVFQIKIVFFHYIKLNNYE
jgi:hypothetical protein